MQRTSSDLKINFHIHAVFLDGGDSDEAFAALGHLRGQEVADVRAEARCRIEKVLTRAEPRTDDDSELALLTSYERGGRPPAGPAPRRSAKVASARPTLGTRRCSRCTGLA